MAKEFGRNQRVSSQMQKELAEILQRDMHDDRLGFITVNEVVVSKDLAVAKVYVTIMNISDKDKDKHINVLNELGPQIRSQLAKRMRLRHISDIRFNYDDSIETGLRVSQLLAEGPESPNDN